MPLAKIISKGSKCFDDLYIYEVEKVILEKSGSGKLNYMMMVFVILMFSKLSMLFGWKYFRIFQFIFFINSQI